MFKLYIFNSIGIKSNDILIAFKNSTYSKLSKWLKNGEMVVQNYGR